MVSKEFHPTSEVLTPGARPSVLGKRHLDKLQSSFSSGRTQSRYRHGPQRVRPKPYWWRRRDGSSDSESVKNSAPRFRHRSFDRRVTSGDPSTLAGAPVRSSPSHSVLRVPAASVPIRLRDSRLGDQRPLDGDPGSTPVVPSVKAGPVKRIGRQGLRCRKSEGPQLRDPTGVHDPTQGPAAPRVMDCASSAPAARTAKGRTDLGLTWSDLTLPLNSVSD